MSLGTYGLADSMSKPPRIGGPTVTSLYGADSSAAMGLANSAAGQQTQRDINNANQAQEADAGNAKLGAAVGGMAGMAFGGPLGGMLGSTVGGLLGGAF